MQRLVQTYDVIISDSSEHAVMINAADMPSQPSSDLIKATFPAGGGIAIDLCNGDSLFLAPSDNGDIEKRLKQRPNFLFATGEPSKAEPTGLWLCQL